MDAIASTPIDHRDRALGALLGLAVGDAIGTTLEFTRRDAHPPLTDMVGKGHFRLKPGEWTDDTSMALCLAESLIANRGDLEPHDLMSRFLGWYRRGENSVTGHCFDIGNTTREALEELERTGRTAADFRADPNQAGNGTLMRLAPVAIVAWSDPAKAIQLAIGQSRTTHRANLAHEACRYFAALLVAAIAGKSREEVLRPRGVLGSLGPVAAGGWRTKDRSQISSSGYVLSTLEASLWCVGRTANFEEAVLLAANLADDADTVAAVTGQLAGALYGRAGIPPRWLKRLAWRGQIEARVDTLLALAPEKQNMEAAPQPKRSPPSLTHTPAWTRRFYAGDFEALPASFGWKTSVHVAHMINGYTLCSEGFEGLSELADLTLQRLEVRDREIAPLDLWATLFFQHRAHRHHGGEAEGKELQRLDQLCQALRSAILKQDVYGLLALRDAMEAASL